MGEDELLFLICHEFAKPSEAEAETEETGGTEDGGKDDDQTGDDNAAPTRAELETKAVELSIKFDGRTTDKLLAEKIEYVLAEREGE
jgi:hypothetical protein